MTYDEFIAGKVPKVRTHGFDPGPIHSKLFAWQKQIVEWAVRRGRAALFEDCGLGKTFQQLEWAKQVRARTCSKVLILCPLAVAAQTVAEGVKLGIEVCHVREQSEIGEAQIIITNYERLAKFDVSQFAGVVLDESSILKNFMGKSRRLLTDAFAETPYRLCCTATPAPNDYMEFGQHCEFLGVMPANEMLARWFINDTMNFGTYRLKGHARKSFWEWVASWAACLSLPSDLGYSDDGFVLPPLNLQVITVDAGERPPGDGLLLNGDALSATTMHREKRLTCKSRGAKAAEMVNGSQESWVVWCDTNYEADELKPLIPGAVEVRGSDTPERKEAALNRFTTSQARVIITKPSVAGHGLNWQHCANHVFVGLSYSFEEFYQAMRRGYRFGQQKPFNCYILQAETEAGILATVKEKMNQHAEMREEMKLAAAAMRETHETLKLNTSIYTESGRNWTLNLGDCCRIAKTIKPDSVDFSVYSPPFANLYIYSDDAQDMGNCAGTPEFLEQYRFLIAEKFRVTKPGCLSAVHCKNLVRYKGRDGRSGLHDFRGDIIREHEACGWQYHSEFVIWKDPVIEMQRTKAQGLLFKQLCQNSRYSRAGMPEYVLMFRKWGEDMDLAVSHPQGEVEHWNFIGDNPPTPAECSDERYREINTWQRYASPVWMDIRQTRVLNGKAGREKRDEKHICPLQLDVIERLIWLYTAKGDLVYSPFTGIGSEGFIAVGMGRKFIGSELKEAYFRQAIQWLEKAEREAGAELVFDAPPAAIPAPVPA